MNHDLNRYLRLRNADLNGEKILYKSKFFLKSLDELLNESNYSEEIIKQSFELLRDDKIDYSKLIQKN